MFIDNESSFDPDRNPENSNDPFSRTDLILYFLETHKDDNNFEALLDGQAKLKRPLASFSHEDVERLTLHCIHSLKEALDSNSPEMAIAFSGYVGTIRDFSPSYGEDGKEFWESVTATLREFDSELELKIESDPEIWEHVAPSIRTGLAWIEFPFGASESLKDVNLSVKLSECYLEISMKKLADLIDGDGCLRMAHEMSDESNPLVDAYDSATTVLEKTKAATEDLERTFSSDLPGELFINGTPEEVSEDIGRIKIQCTTRVKYLLKASWVVSSIKEIDKPWYKFW